jgi:hypothetical protein
VPYIFVAGVEYPLLGSLFKLYSGKNLDPDDVHFNKEQHKSRKTIECAFGILYSKSICRNNRRRQVAKIAKAACYLQNVIFEKG